MSDAAAGERWHLSEAGTAAPFSSDERRIPPSADEIEISLFGPGFGECVIIHVGNGEWIIADSCLADDGKTPVAVEYLRLLGVDLAAAVSHLIISHADNDHIGGAAYLFQQCASARLVYSAALAERDVLAWIAFYSEVDPSRLSRASTEIAEILESIPARRHSTVMRAVQDRFIFQNNHCRLTALSPNDRRIEQFVASVAAQLPQAGVPRRRSQYPTPNQASVALLLESPYLTAILGADLEEIPGEAWSHIVANSLAYAGARPAALLKVPHHGSKNAYCHDLWQRLEQPPLAILATFNRGNKLPSPDDVARILAHTERAYSCASFIRSAALKSHEIDKFLKVMDVRRQRRFPSAGHIRVRIGRRRNTVELFGNAVHLSKVH